MTSWGRGRPPVRGYRFCEVLWRQHGVRQQRGGEIGSPVPPSCHHRGTPELSSAVEGEIGSPRTPELSSSLYPRAVVSVLYSPCPARARWIVP